MILNGKYERKEKLGSGSYGVVYKSSFMSNTYALKKIRRKDSDTNGIDITTVREISILQEIKHPNIINLIDVFIEKGYTYLVFDYLPISLEKLIMPPNGIKITLQESHIKCILLQILEGLKYLHGNYIFHRDMKPGNVLLTNNGALKISDFGLAKSFAIKYDSKLVLTKYLCTKFYRAPELFFGSQYYGPVIDMWSVGCIFGEMYWRKYMFPGDSDIDMLTRIFSLLGTPNETNWPGVSSLPNFMKFSHVDGVSLREAFPMMSEQGVDLIGKMLCLNPCNRIKADEALHHEYFKEIPFACSPSELPLSELSSIEIKK